MGSSPTKPINTGPGETEYLDAEFNPATENDWNQVEHQMVDIASSDTSEQQNDGVGSAYGQEQIMELDVMTRARRIKKKEPSKTYKSKKKRGKKKKYKLGDFKIQQEGDEEMTDNSAKAQYMAYV